VSEIMPGARGQLSWPDPDHASDSSGGAIEAARRAAGSEAGGSQRTPGRCWWWTARIRSQPSI